MNEPVDCPVCGRKTAILINGVFDATYNQIPVHVEDVEMLECASCGESTLDDAQNRRLDVKIKGFVRQNQGLLPPAKIVAIRKRHNLSQVELEKLLGLGEKVVTRWETGRVLQSKTADDVLQLMDRLPEVVEELRKMRAERRVTA